MTAPPSPSQPCVLYLDMNVWVDMAKGLRTGNARWSELREQLLAGIAAGRLVVPIAAPHYLELWHRRETESRRSVAVLMRDVSGYATIPSAHVVRQLEARELAMSWTGRIRDHIKPSIQGHGAAHAFGREEGRLRFVERVASADGTIREGAPAAPPVELAQLIGQPAVWEWFQLVGDEQLLEDHSGLDRTPQHRFGSTSLEDELRMREFIRERSLSREALRDLIDAQEFDSIREYIAEAVVDLGGTPPPVLTAVGAFDPAHVASVRPVVRAMPSAHTWSTLRYHKHRDLSLPWDQHDWIDLTALSVALPYCDIVITEKRWAHLGRVSGLDSEFGTRIAAGLPSLEAEVDRAIGM